jgi:hypothetical protein
MAWAMRLGVMICANGPRSKPQPDAYTLREQHTVIVSRPAVRQVTNILFSIRPHQEILHMTNISAAKFLVRRDPRALRNNHSLAWNRQTNAIT